MERYADVRSHFPNATVSFVGHSNGSYLAANAIKVCAAIRFERIVFAGSVVRRDYPWHARGAQVKSVLNYVGSADFVVALLPAVFEFLRLRIMDVGGAGAFGFSAAGASRQGGPLVLNEVQYVQGGHGAAIEEGFWPEIARFVLKGEVPVRAPVLRQPGVKTFFACAPVFITVLIGVALIFLVSPLLLAIGGVLLLSDSLNHVQTGDAVSGLTKLLAAYPTLWPLGAAVLAIISVGLSWLARRFLRAW